jgi:hypothetical protein
VLLYRQCKRLFPPAAFGSGLRVAGLALMRRFGMVSVGYFGGRGLGSGLLGLEEAEPIPT